MGTPQQDSSDTPLEAPGALMAAPFGVYIRRIKSLEPQPFASHLAYAYVEGARALVYREEFQPGALVAYVPANSILPDWLLKHLRLWDVTSGRGRLAGSAGNLILPGHKSAGLCVPVRHGVSQTDHEIFEAEEDREFYFIEVNRETFGFRGVVVQEGDEVSHFLGIQPAPARS